MVWFSLPPSPGCEANDERTCDSADDDSGDEYSAKIRRNLGRVQRIKGKSTLTRERGVECSEVHLCSILGVVKMVDFGRCLRFASSIGLNR